MFSSPEELRNYVVMRNLAIQIPRALGPPVARALIDTCGRPGLSSSFEGFLNDETTTNLELQ